MKTIQLINGQELQLFYRHNPCQPFTDIDLFAANVQNIIANEKLIFSDSRIFMCPIDMNCGLAYSGRFKPTTLGAYVEWWLNYPEAHDYKGNPLLRLSGSPLSGANSCVATSSEGKAIPVKLNGSFNAAYKSFLGISKRYREDIMECEVYTFNHILQLIEEQGIPKEYSDMKDANVRLIAELEHLHRKLDGLERYIEDMSDEYRAAILAPHIAEVKRLHEAYCHIELHADSVANEYTKIKTEAKARLKNNELTQQEYRAIREDCYEKIREVRAKVQNFWIEEMKALFRDSAKYFTPSNITHYLDKDDSNSNPK